MDRREIKARIDDLSNNLISLYGHGVSSPGTVLTIYIGQETQELLKELIEEAFGTSFNAKPVILEMLLDDLSEEGSDFREYLTSVITNAGRRGENLNGLRVIFVALMDDPVFAEGCSKYVLKIEQAFQGLEKMGMPLRQVAFYGLFRSKKVEEWDYSNSFVFVRAGKRLWNNIYHAEVPFYKDDLKEYANMIAVHCIADSFYMKQDSAQDAYVWESICLHCLKVPEFMIAWILYKIYDSQIGNKDINNTDWVIKIRETLENGFDRIFGDDLSGCEQFIPLNYRETPPVSVKRHGLFGKKTTQIIFKYSYTDIAKDPDILESFVSSAYSDRIFHKNEYDRIFEEVITSAYVIDDQLIGIIQSIDNVLKLIEKEYLERKNILLSKTDYIVEDSDIDKVLALSLQKEREKAVINKKIEMIRQLRENLKSNETISKVIKELFNRNHELKEILQEISINEYGGFSKECKTNDYPWFPINSPVEEVLTKLDQRWLAEIIRDRTIVLQQLKAFLNKEIGRLSGLHLLGENAPGLPPLEQVMTVMLMPLSQGGDSEYKDVVLKAGVMEIKKDSIFRESTFYMISRRKYISEKYIRRYYRGD